MNTEVTKLAELIKEASDLLIVHGEKQWGSWLLADAQRVRSLDFYGVEHMLSAFGGMGSINDLVLHPMNGHKVDVNEVSIVNRRLNSLLERIYALAVKLKREEENAGKDS